MNSNSTNKENNKDNLSNSFNLIKNTLPSTSYDSSNNFKRQGSMRKVLPPSDVEPPNMLVHDIEKEKLLQIFHQEYLILAEYKMLRTENIPGVYVIPSFNSSFLWFGVIFVRSDLYEGGVFRFTITLPDTFPDHDIPIVEFQTKVYHPLINYSTGELNIKEAFNVWIKGETRIWQLLKFIHYIFNNLNERLITRYQPVNLEAAELFVKNMHDFKIIVTSCVNDSIQRIYDEPDIQDEHYIKFSPSSDAITTSLKKYIEKMKNEDHAAISEKRSWSQSGIYSDVKISSDNVS